MPDDYTEDHLKALRSQQIPGEPSPSFVEVEPFGALWAKLGLNDADMHVLQGMILVNPMAGVVVAGTSGLRKIRFTPPGSGRGKSGAYRVFYLEAVEHGVIFLFAVFAKSEQENLSKEQRNKVGQRVALIKAALQRRDRRG